MKRIAIIPLILVLVLTAEAQQLAFPGAEGFGRYAVGGRGGTIYEVTNLNDSGPNSLRAAVEASEPRTVVFRVSGTIELQSELKVEYPYITIAGQTAPGGGICLKNYMFKVKTDHVIIRYMRFRLGRDGGAYDSMWVWQGRNIIIDHCSASWAGDETLSVATDSNNLGNVTVQWCMITESLNYADHGYGSLIRGCYGNGYTFHHNLYAHNYDRNPRPGNYIGHTTDPDGLIFDFRNNVIYNWGEWTAGYNNDGYDGTNSITKMNFVGNYYKHGPNSIPYYEFAFCETCPYSRAYFSGNYMNGSYPLDPWDIVYLYDFNSAEEAAYKLSEPVSVAPVQTEDAETAYEWVLADAGASFPERDAVDVNVINDVINGTGSIIDDENEVGGYPVLESTTPPADTDHDGMPDDWELARGLDPDDAGDGAEDRDGDGYTNVEEYLNWLCSTAAKADLDDDFDIDLEDFAVFAEHWPEISCDGQNNWCGGADLTRDGDVNWDDLKVFTDNWLAGK